MADVSWVYKRAGGRRRVNAARRRGAAVRRRQVLPLLISGVKQSEIARRLHVDRAQICRDAKFLDDLVDLVRTAPQGRVTIGPGEWTFEQSNAQDDEVVFQRLSEQLSQIQKELEGKPDQLVR